MRSEVPTYKRINWIYFIPQILLFLILYVVFGKFGFTDPVLTALIFQLTLSLILKFTFGRYHRRGMALVREGKYIDAIESFRRSRRYFEEHPLVDKYRSIAMLSVSALGYREMAMINEAFCLSQVGRRDESIDLYRKVLDDYPGIGMAIAAIRMMDGSQSS